MTAQQTLKAALDKYGKGDKWLRREHPDYYLAILEAMEQHRNAGLDEVETWLNSEVCNPKSEGMDVISITIASIWEGAIMLVKKKIAALKTPPAGGLQNTGE